MDDAMERQRIQEEMIEELRYLYRKLELVIRYMDNNRLGDSEAYLRMAIKCAVSSTDCLKEDLHLLNYLKFRLNTTERKDEQNAGNCCGEDYPCKSEGIPEEEH